MNGRCTLQVRSVEMLSRTVLRGVGLGVMGALCLSAVLGATSDAPVAEAVMAGEKDKVRALLKQGLDVNAAQGDGMTALHWAARRGDLELAQMLLYAGANVRATTRLGAYTPLLMASQVGDARVIDLLLKAGADAKGTTSNGTTPLMLAAVSGQADAVRLLVEHGGDPNATETARGQTALMFATNYNRVDAMKVLIEKGADLGVATKVVDLAALTSPDEEAFRQFQQQQQQQAAPGGPPSAGAPARPDVPAAAPGAPQGGGQQAAAGPGGPQGGPGGSRGAGAAQGNRGPDVPGVTRQFRFNELVSTHGGLTPLLFATRQGHLEAVKTLLDAGADINQVNPGDKTSPLLMAVINGHYDLAAYLVDRGADVRLAATNGVTPLYATLNVQWAPKALYPQPRAYAQQKMTHLDLMKVLIDKGADVNARLRMKVWYSGYNFDLAGVDEIGATPFWRAAYASDVDAMKLLVAHGADPNIRTARPAGRPRTGDGGRESVEDVSGQPPVPIGGPAVTPLQAATGVGYAEGFAANSHRYSPGGMMAAARYLIEELGADVNARDHEGNTALHHAAARGDVEMILYLVSKGADVKAVNREGQTTADMANGPVQRTQPYPEALELLVKLGAKNNNKCVSC
jgi:uncharacterized protein